MPEQTKVVALKNVSLAYPAGNISVDKISLDIFKSEVVGLVGSNASGKTSLLKVIAGYMSMTGGDIALGGISIGEYNERMLNDFMIFVEQNPESQLTGPTVEDELARNCRLRGMKGRVIETTVSNILQEIELPEGRDWFLDEISIGERRRVALGLALLGAPKLLLLDEPLSDLDDQGVSTTISLLRKFKEKGTSILLTSHKLDDAINIADRICVLEHGKLLAVNKPEEIIRETEALQKAGISLPQIPSLLLELESAGAVSFDKCPLDLKGAKEIIASFIKPS
ncbi:ABC transporter ATP-binding protein [Fibrobacterota bacterium]